MKVFGQLESAQFENLASDPSNTPTGRAYFDTALVVAKVYDGTAWRNFVTADAIQVLTNKDYDGGAASNLLRLTLPKNSTGTLNGLTRKQGTLVYDTTTASVKFDDGATLIELASASGVFNFNDGTAGAPSIRFTSDTDTGFYRVGADTVGVSTGGTLRLSISTTALTSTLLLLAADGSAAAPAQSFTNDPDTGMYSSAANSLSFTTAGTLRMTLSTALRIVDGTAAAPAFSFLNDTDSGLFLNGANSIGIATGGATRFIIEQNTLQAGSSGTVGAPNYTWDGDEDTGFYRVGANQLGFTTGGSLRVTLDSTALDSLVPLWAPFGTAANPSISFGLDDNTGLYRSASNQLSVATNGAETARFTAANNFCVPSGGITSGSVLSADLLQWKVFTGTLASAASATLACPGTTILGVIGYGDNFVPIAYFDASVLSFVSSTTGNAKITNGAGGSRDYTVVMYYQ